MHDHPDQPEQAFFRSDHRPYVRVGIPELFYSSWLEPDYHTPRDEAKLINEEKLARMTTWMYTTGWFVSESATRVTMDAGFKLER